MPVADEQHPWPLIVPRNDYRKRRRSNWSKEPQAVMICGPHMGRLAIVVGRVPRATVLAVAVYLPAIKEVIVTVPSHLEAIRPMRGGHANRPRRRGGDGEEASA